MKRSTPPTVPPLKLHKGTGQAYVVFDGQHWQTQEIALWESKSQRWGFPVFRSNGTKDPEQWHSSVPTSLGDDYAGFCRAANTMLLGIWHDVLRLHDAEP